MKAINWKSIYGEILSVAAYVLYFETPSLQAWAGHHPDTKLAAVIAVLVAMGMKPSSVKTTTPEAK